MVALTGIAWRGLRPTRRDLGRALAAGTAWGLAMAAGLAGLSLAECGAVCPDEVAFTAAAGTVAGTLALGPLAAYGGRRPR